MPSLIEFVFSFLLVKKGLEQTVYMLMEWDDWTLMLRHRDGILIT